MSDVTITHDELLGVTLALRHAKPKNALASVKLNKIRKAALAELEPVAAAFDETGQRHATKDADEKPVVVQKGGEPLQWTATGTPVYDIAADAKAAYDAEIRELLAAPVTLSVPLLGPTDLASIDIAEDIGAALAVFAEGV